MIRRTVPTAQLFLEFRRLYQRFKTEKKLNYSEEIFYSLQKNKKDQQ
jgi:hypothetical protein